MFSPTSRAVAHQLEEEEAIESDYSNFVNDQINRLISAERQSSPKLSRTEELNVAIKFCKNYLADSSSSDQEKRSQVLAKLVELRLELDQLEDSISQGEVAERMRRHRGHEFTLQPSQGRNPYCEICLCTIWRLAQQWRRCKLCGLRSHDKCIDEVTRPCAGLRVRRSNFAVNLRLCPESGLLAQTYKCAECLAHIGFGKGAEFEPRICDYTGKYYCKRCHWNDEMVIPARVVRNWDCTKRPVCRASKQLLTLVENKPLLNLNRENPALFKYVNALNRMQQLRTSVILMKCYFMCCKKARKLRILQYLNRHQHFVESDDMYTLNDLVQVANGFIVQELESIVAIFKQHITQDCEICLGNAFICEICRDDKIIFPFSENVSICRTCCAVYHQPCYSRVSKRCPRCMRRRARKSLSESLPEEEDFMVEEEQKDESNPADTVSIKTLTISNAGEESKTNTQTVERRISEEKEESEVAESEITTSSPRATPSPMADQSSSP